MEYIADIVLIVLFLMMVFIGVKRGFAKSVLSIAGTIASFVLSYIFGKPLAGLLYVGFVDARIKQSLANEFSGQLSSAVDVYTEITDIVASIPTGLVNLASRVGLDITGLMDKLNSTEITPDTVIVSITDIVIKPVVLTIMTLLCCVLVFALSSLLFGLIIRMVDKVFNLPVLGAANKILGGLLGIVKGVVFIIIICMTLNVIYGLLDGGTSARIIEGSRIVDFYNSQSFLTKYLIK